MDISKFLQETELPNLYVIPAGNIPPNPSELLISPKMKKMLNELKKIVDDNLDKFSKEEQQELYKKINYAIDAGTKAKSKKKMLNLIKELKKHRITLTNEEEVIAAINNGFE